MKREERGIVVELRGRTALVQLPTSGACADCASAGRCRSAGGDQRLLEARNAVGASVGDSVRLAVPTRFVDSPALPWALGAALLLAGAAAATLLAPLVLPPSLAGNAAGLGGIVGAAAGVLLARRIRGSRGARRADLPLPEITCIERPAGVDSTGSRG